jgi:hypothetical protein
VIAFPLSAGIVHVRFTRELPKMRATGESRIFPGAEDSIVTATDGELKALVPARFVAATLN